MVEAPRRATALNRPCDLVRRPFRCGSLRPTRLYRRNEHAWRGLRALRSDQGSRIEGRSAFAPVTLECCRLSARSYDSPDGCPRASLWAWRESLTAWMARFHSASISSYVPAVTSAAIVVRPHRFAASTRWNPSASQYSSPSKRTATGAMASPQRITASYSWIFSSSKFSGGWKSKRDFGDRQGSDLNRSGLCIAGGHYKVTRSINLFSRNLCR